MRALKSFNIGSVSGISIARRLIIGNVATNRVTGLSVSNAACAGEPDSFVARGNDLPRAKVFWKSIECGFTRRRVKTCKPGIHAQPDRIRGCRSQAFGQSSLPKLPDRLQLRIKPTECFTRFVDKPNQAG